LNSTPEQSYAILELKVTFDYPGLEAERTLAAERFCALNYARG